VRVNPNHVGRAASVEFGETFDILLLVRDFPVFNFGQRAALNIYSLRGILLADVTKITPSSQVMSAE